MGVIIFIIGLIFGLFSFSQIIYPFFFTVPKLFRLHREEKIKKSTPVYMILIAPIVWLCLTCGSILIVQKYFFNHLESYLVPLGVVLVIVVYQMFKNNKDLEKDFMDTWEEYW